MLIYGKLYCSIYCIHLFISFVILVLLILIIEIEFNNEKLFLIISHFVELTLKYINFLSLCFGPSYSIIKGYIFF